MIGQIFICAIPHVVCVHVQEEYDETGPTIVHTKCFRGSGLAGREPKCMHLWCQRPDDYHTFNQQLVMTDREVSCRGSSSAGTLSVVR